MPTIYRHVICTFFSHKLWTENVVEVVLEG